MALKKCIGCGKEIRGSAKLCPYCGTQYLTGGMTTSVKLFIALVVMSALVLMIKEESDSSKVQNDNHPVTPAPLSAVSKFSPAQVESGHSLHVQILDKHPNIDQFYHKAYIFGSLTEHPLSVISVPSADWQALSKEERNSLEAYAASWINAIRSAPFNYTKIPASAPIAPMILRNVSRMTINSWGIVVGAISQDGQDIMSDEIVVKGH